MKFITVKSCALWSYLHSAGSQFHLLSLASEQTVSREAGQGAGEGQSVRVCRRADTGERRQWAKIRAEGTGILINPNL